MTSLITEAEEIQEFIENEGWDFYFIGGIVVQIWGQPRLTQDIDVTVFTNLSNESAFISKFLERFEPKFAGVSEFALTNRILPMYTKNGTGIDVSLGGLSDISQALERSSYQQFAKDIKLRVCSAEDLIINKTIASRGRDWIDIESVVIKQQVLDWEYIDSSLIALNAYEDLSSRISKLHEVKAQFYQK